MTYNGHELREFLPERTAVYVEQEDQHMPELTVRETFDFSARCQGIGSNAGLPVSTPGLIWQQVPPSRPKKAARQSVPSAPPALPGQRQQRRSAFLLPA